MIIPIRCYSCGRVTGNKWNIYTHKLNNGMHPRDALNALGITKMCCRQVFLGHVQLIDKINRYTSY